MDKINLGNGTRGSGDTGYDGGNKINNNLISIVQALNGDTIWSVGDTDTIDLSGLSTTNKSNLVAAINEIINQKATANGLASLDGSGLVPSTQLPSYVDDVQEYPDLASFPTTGETGKIYIAIDTSYTYRWSGSAYIQLTDQTAIWGQISGDVANQTDLLPYIATVVDKAFVDALGIDADTLDGLNSSAFYSASNPNNYIDASNVVFDNTTQTITGAKTFNALLTVNNNVVVTSSNSPKISIQETGQELYEILAAGSGLFFKNDGDNQMFLEQGGDIGFYKNDGNVGLYWEAFFGNLGIGTGTSVPAYKLEVAGDIGADSFKLRGNLNTPPSSASDTGTTGEIRFTSDYIYMCVATNTWKRSPLSTW